MNTCPRCGGKWSVINHQSYKKCETCAAIYEPTFPKFYFRVEQYFLCWFFENKTCRCWSDADITNQAIPLPYDLPFNITLEKIKLYLNFL